MWSELLFLYIYISIFMLHPHYDLYWIQQIFKMFVQAYNQTWKLLDECKR
jgi:hypothetical protein